MGNGRRSVRGTGCLRSLTCSKSGAASVEFALMVFFILIPFLLGLFEIGRALQHHHVVSKSVRDAARYAARIPGYSPATPFESTPCAETTGDAGDVKDLAMYGKVNPNSDPPLLGYWTAYSTVCIDGPFNVPVVEPVSGTTLNTNVVRVRAAVPFEDVGLLTALGTLTGTNIGSITFSLSHEERYIGE